MNAHKLNAIEELALGYSGLLFNKAVPYLLGWCGKPTAKTYCRAKDNMLEIFLAYVIDCFKTANILPIITLTVHTSLVHTLVLERPNTSCR